ncbi:hypothetical protein ACGF5O_17990 [Streptomyces sp. NPDC048291]|uniref:hypothetical protein n=1 Tax=Streptomyces sp. NPDC048291 TaxID=3365530 RepID=UPI00371530D2
MISVAVVLACVINGDTVSGALRQATWLVVAIIVLIIVQAVAVSLPGLSVKPGVLSDTNV